MKNYLLFLVLCSLTIRLAAQQTIYSRIKIYPDTKTPEQLFATGIEITVADLSEQWFIAEISKEDIIRISDAGFRYEVIIPDMAKYYTERFHEKSSVSQTDILLNETWPPPVNFSLGSCGGFSTIGQIIEHLDKMRLLYPSLISVKQALSDTITTVEGRTVYYVRISDNPDINEAEPEVLYTGMHHSTEPVSMQHLIFYMWYLLENYNSDPAIKGLVDNTEMYFVPVFNVDGYNTNITNNPYGGGLWRKNRRNNGDGSFGIDINRNYGFKWGFDDTGSSPVPASEMYRGIAPFSEPETRMMKYFCENYNFSIALNYHSFRSMILYPWGWTNSPTPGNNLFEIYANLMRKQNDYTPGTSFTTIYPTNGGSDDWMYGEQATKPAIIALTPEIGSISDGYWPSYQRILPLIQENMFTSITAARLAGKYGTIRDASPFFINGQNGYLNFEVQRIGRQDGNHSVSIKSIDDAFISVGHAKTLSGINLLEKQTDSISYQLRNALKPGDTIRYVLSIDNGYFSEQDTVVRIFGDPLTIFNDDLSNGSKWTGDWNITSEQYFSPSSSMTDSPGENYLPDENKYVTIANEVEIGDALLMVLQFRAKWALEKGFDFVQVSISNDNGVTWIPLQGKYTHPGAYFSGTFEQNVYNGINSEWIREEISLNEYRGKKVIFRFRIHTDREIQLDGFYFDDFNISMLLDPTSVGENNVNPVQIGIPYPNPVASCFNVNFKLPKYGANNRFIITSVTGPEVRAIRINRQEGVADIDVSMLPAGFYYLQLLSDDYRSPLRKLIVK